MSAGLLKSTSVVSLMTLISRIFGFVRDVVMAALFGAGAAMDAFFIAFRIPNLFRRMFAEGAFAQAFVPVFTEAKNTRSPEEVRRLVDAVSGTLMGVLLVLTAAAVIAAPLLMWLFAPGFTKDPGKFDQAVGLLRWTFPYLLFISLTALVGGILNAHGRFAVPAFAPVWLNVCLIAAALWYAPSVEALAIAVFVAGVVQLAFQLPAVARLGLLPRPRWGWRDPDVRRIMRLMVPIMFGASITQISLLVDSIIASLLPGHGSVSWLWYADRLLEFPLGTFSIAIATVILPSLAAHHASKSPQGFSDTLDWAMRAVVIVGLPAALGLLLLAGPLVSTLFQHNAFTATDVTMTAWALSAYSLGFLGFSFVKILIPGFYARQEARTPIRCGMIALGIAIVMSITLSFTLVQTGFFAPHAGIAFSTACGAWINAGLLWWYLRRYGVYRPAPGWPGFLLRVGLAAIAMSVFLLAMAGDVQSWTSAPATERIYRLAWLIPAAMVIYFAVLRLVGMRPIKLLRGV